MCRYLLGYVSKKSADRFVTVISLQNPPRSMKNQRKNYSIKLSENMKSCEINQLGMYVFKISIGIQNK